VGFGNMLTSNIPSFEPQGFKKINLHGIKITGSLSSGIIATPTKGSIINWSAFVSVLGNYQDLGGVSNPLPPVLLDQNITEYKFTELNNYIDFVSPILAIQQFGLVRVEFEAEKMQSPSDINLALNIVTSYFYKYEGEE
jgi:hypothetical protein